MTVETPTRKTAQHTPHVEQHFDVATNPDALLRVKTVAQLAGLGVSSIYLRARTDKTFPKLIKHGTRCTRIRAGDFMAWLKSQATA